MTEEARRATVRSAYNGRCGYCTVQESEAGAELELGLRGCLRNIRFGHPKAIKPGTSLMSKSGLLVQESKEFLSTLLCVLVAVAKLSTPVYDGR